MSSAFKLGIVIVNFRTAGLVVDCLASLASPGAVPDATRIVVVDGASGDGSVEQISAAIERNRWADRVDLLPLDLNGGFSYANNRGIEHLLARFGRPGYFLLLNPDTVVRPRGLAPLVKFMDENAHVGIAGSRLEDPDGTPQACAFRFPSIAAEFESEARTGPITRLLDRWQVAPNLPETAVAVDWVSGASMIIRMDVLDDIGGLDEDYFLYFEEVDFCMRARRAGWECWYVPQSRVVHLVGQATGVTQKSGSPARRPPYWFHSRRRYYVKHHGRFYEGIASAFWISGHLLWRARLLVEGKRWPGPPRLLRDFIAHMGLFRGT